MVQLVLVMVPQKVVRKRSLAVPMVMVACHVLRMMIPVGKHSWVTVRRKVQF